MSRFTRHDFEMRQRGRAALAVGCFAGLVLMGAPAFAQVSKSPQQVAQDRQADPAAGTGKTTPAKPTGGGPTSGEAAPTPPAEQTVILPSASGHVNSAAPTMNRSCETVSPNAQGSPDGATDPCHKPAEPGDRRTAPQMSD